MRPRPHAAPVVPLSTDDLVGPTDVELAAIDEEWPVNQAELALVSAECAHALWPSQFTARRIRGAGERLTQAVLAAVASPTTHDIKRNQGA